MLSARHFKRRRPGWRMVLNASPTHLVRRVADWSAEKKVRGGPTLLVYLKFSARGFRSLGVRFGFQGLGSEGRTSCTT